MAEYFSSFSKIIKLRIQGARKHTNREKHTHTHTHTNKSIPRHIKIRML